VRLNFEHAVMSRALAGVIASAMAMTGARRERAPCSLAHVWHHDVVAVLASVQEVRDLAAEARHVVKSGSVTVCRGVNCPAVRSAHSDTACCVLAFGN